MARKRKSKPKVRKVGELDWLERVRPTVEIAVEDPTGQRKARRNTTRCVQSEAWRHNRLTGMQREAEREMDLAWRAITAGLGAASSRYGATAGRSNRTDIASRSQETWRTWASEAPRCGISVKVVIQCLTTADTLGDVDRDHRMRRGEAFKHYTAALDLWCKLRGWMRADATSEQLALEVA